MAEELHHILQIHDTHAELNDHLDNNQIAIETDSNFLAYRDDTGVYHLLQNQGDAMTAGDITCDDLVITTGHGLTVTDFAEGGILFAITGGVIAQNASNLFWDNSNIRVGIGTNVPLGVSHILKILSGDTDEGMNINIGFDTASSGTFVRNTTLPLRETGDTGTLTDDGILTIAKAAASDENISGFGFASCYNQSIVFYFTNGNVVKIAGTTDTAVTATDGKLCVYGLTANEIVLKNALGDTYNILYRIFYGKTTTGT